MMMLLGTLMALVLVVLLHELAHIIAARLCGVRCYGLGVQLRPRPAFGARVLNYRRPDGSLAYSRAQRLAIVAAGPFVDVALALAACLLVPSLAAVCAILAVVNLLPLRGSDGWHILHA